jgi:hypothetical protein
LHAIRCAQHLADLLDHERLDGFCRQAAEVGGARSVVPVLGRRVVAVALTLLGRASRDQPEQARETIRGTGGLVDGVRSVYALWNPKEDQAKAICKALAEPFERGRG